jgi:hypothetical protein
MQYNTGRRTLGRSQQHNLDLTSIAQWKKNEKIARDRERKQRTAQWNVSRGLVALVDQAVGTFEGQRARNGLSVPDKRVMALLALDGWKVDPETWTMVRADAAKSVEC